MDTTDLKVRIKALNIEASDEIIAKVLELHAKSVTDATIRRAWREVDKKAQAAKKAAKDAEKAAKEAAKKNAGATGTPTPATPAAAAA